MAIKDTLKKRRLYTQENTNKEIKEKKYSGKIVSRREQKEIYEKYRKESMNKYPLKK